MHFLSAVAARAQTAWRSQNRDRGGSEDARIVGSFLLVLYGQALLIIFGRIGFSI
jgi:hypothetical protein